MSTTKETEKRVRAPAHGEKDSHLGVVRAPAHRENHSQLAMPAQLQAYLEQTLGRFESITGDVESLWAAGKRGLQMETAGKILAGRAFQELKNSLLPGQFSAELASRMIARRSAYDAIEVYELFAALPDIGVVQALAQLGITKAMAIKAWDKKDQQALASGKAVRGITLDAAVEMSTREFDEKIRDPELVKADKKIATLEAAKEGLQAELKDLKGQLRHRYDSINMPEFAAHARQEGVALAEQITLSLTALEDLVTDRLIDNKEAKQFPDWKNRAAGTVFHSALAAQARMQALVERMREEFGDAVTGKLDFEFTLSKGEAEIAKDALGVIQKRHADLAHNREADRKNQKGGRGRPMDKRTVS